MNCEKMNCEHCEKKLSDMSVIATVGTSHVNEVGQKVDTGIKELYFCSSKCGNKFVEHTLVKRKIIFMKETKEKVEKLEKGYEHGEISTLILIHYYEAIINFIRNKISEETFQFFAQDAMEVGNQMSDAAYLSIIRDTQYAIAMMA